MGAKRRKGQARRQVLRKDQAGEAVAQAAGKGYREKEGRVGVGEDVGEGGNRMRRRMPSHFFLLSNFLKK